ncbi:ribonuclease E/G [Acetobacter sp. AN02]|uniref:ribonuclease E/G n=1 Tax=Acetobacter sp. AN02 TaxID=2894186 RepID=UPI002434164A|nr:ribonuclease E/G [Acetobacter sp. AN02]MDG6094419.1 ribonuclease E/G [Acetobacter sp. AN02]
MTSPPVIRVACSPGEARVAVTREEVLLEFALWRPAAPDGTDEIHLGRVTARRPELGGAFVTLAGHEPGFLPDQEGKTALQEGAVVTVRIVRPALGGKGPRLKPAEHPADTSQAPRLLVPAPSPVERLAARYPDSPILIDNPGFAARLPSALNRRIQIVTSAFTEQTADAAEALTRPEVLLPGGMTATITPTPALVAVDMDSGTALGGRDSKQRAQYAANLHALPDLLAQIRLRELSGAILIDPAGLAVRKRLALREPVEALLKNDPAGPRLLGVSALGFLEVVRPRRRAPLHELLDSPHGRALDALRCAVRQHRPGDSRELRCGTALFRALGNDPEALREAVSGCDGRLRMRVDLSLNLSAWELHDA